MKCGYNSNILRKVKQINTPPNLFYPVCLCLWVYTSLSWPKVDLRYLPQFLLQSRLGWPTSEVQDSPVFNSQVFSYKQQPFQLFSWVLGMEFICLCLGCTCCLSYLPSTWLFSKNHIKHIENLHSYILLFF